MEVPSPSPYLSDPPPRPEPMLTTVMLQARASGKHVIPHNCYYVDFQRSIAGGGPKGRGIVPGPAAKISIEATEKESPCCPKGNVPRPHQAVVHSVVDTYFSWIGSVRLQKYEGYSGGTTGVIGREARHALQPMHNSRYKHELIRAMMA